MLRPLTSDLFIRPAHTLNPILTTFGMWDGPPDVYLKFVFLGDQFPNYGAVGGQTSPLSH